MNKLIMKRIGWTLFFVYFVLFLILSEYTSQIDPAPRYRIFNAVNKFFADFAFWTTQTNLMFFVFFIFVALDGKWGLWKPKTHGWIYFLSYMTLTMALFWLSLISVAAEKDIVKNPLNIYSNQYNSFSKWFITCNTHLYTFIFTVIFFIFATKKQYIATNNWYKKDLFMGWLYPLIYLIYVIVRMLIMSSIGIEHFKIGQMNNESLPSWINDDFVTIQMLAAPYFFFNYNVIFGQEMILWGTIGCLLLVSSVQFFWLKVSNRISNKKFKSFERAPNYFQKLTLREFSLEVIKILCSLLVICYTIVSLATKALNGEIFADKTRTMYDFIFVFYYVMILIFTLVIIGSSCWFIFFNKRKYNLATLTCLILGFFVIYLIAIPIVLISATIGANYFNKNKIK